MATKVFLHRLAVPGSLDYLVVTVSGLVGYDSLELHCLVVTVSGLVGCDSLELDCLSWL